MLAGGWGGWVGNRARAGAAARAPTLTTTCPHARPLNHPPHPPPHTQILPRQNEKDPSRVDVDVMVREKPVQTADIEAEWSIAPGERGVRGGRAGARGKLRCRLPRHPPTHPPTRPPPPPLPPGDSGRPSLVSLVPGGTILYENRNLFK